MKVCLLYSQRSRFHSLQKSALWLTSFVVQVSHVARIDGSPVQACNLLQCRHASNVDVEENSDVGLEHRYTGLLDTMPRDKAGVIRASAILEAPSDQ